MVFHRAIIKSNLDVLNANILVNNEFIDRINNTTFLGVIIDAKLKWSKHTIVISLIRFLKELVL